MYILSPLSDSLQPNESWWTSGVGCSCEKRCVLAVLQVLFLLIQPVMGGVGVCMCVCTLYPLSMDQTDGFQFSQSRLRTFNLYFIIIMINWLLLTLSIT